jgi:hypothetical protein
MERDVAKEARDEKREAHPFMNVLDECRRRLDTVEDDVDRK